MTAAERRTVDAVGKQKQGQQIVGSFDVRNHREGGEQQCTACLPDST